MIIIDQYSTHHSYRFIFLHQRSNCLHAINLTLFNIHVFLTLGFFPPRSFNLATFQNSICPPPLFHKRCFDRLYHQFLYPDLHPLLPNLKTQFSQFKFTISENDVQIPVRFASLVNESNFIVQNPRNQLFIIPLQGYFQVQIFHVVPNPPFLPHIFDPLQLNHHSFLFAVLHASRGSSKH